MSLLTEPIVVGVAIGLPSSLLGYLGYRRATRVDRITEQNGIASGRTAELNLIVASLNEYIDQLQEDRQSLREEIKYAAQRLVACDEQSEAREKRLRHFRRKYGENGDNGA